MDCRVVGVYIFEGSDCGLCGDVGVVPVDGAGRGLWLLWSGVFCGGQPWLGVLLAVSSGVVALGLVCGLVGGVEFDCGGGVFVSFFLSGNIHGRSSTSGAMGSCPRYFLGKGGIGVLSL